MGGLGLGGLLASRGTGASYAPLRRYALVELGLGVLGLATLGAIPLLAGAYTAWSGTGGTGLVLRLVVAALALLPATMLMGATLPIVSAMLRPRPARRSAARLVLCGQYRRRRCGQPPRRVLPAARARRVRRNVRRGRAECRQCGDCRGALAPQRGAVGARCTGRCAERNARQQRPAPDLPRDRTVGHDGARGRSAVDAPSHAAARRHRLRVRVDRGRFLARDRARQRRGSRHRQALRSGDGARGSANCCSALRSPPPRTRSQSRYRTGRST